VSDARRLAYGPDPSQFGELSVPDGAGPWPVVVVVHGGFWRARYDLTLGRPLADDLVRRGFAAWNIEYRRVGNGGGWPETALDVAAAVDLLASFGTPSAPDGTDRQAQGTDTVSLDLTRVIGLGHSAGGHLAAWLAGRARLPPPFGPPAVALTGVVAQAGVLDLESAGVAHLGDGAVDDFAGGRMTTADDWRSASPARLLPLGVPIRCVHGDRDDTVPIQQSERFVMAARLLGDDAKLITVRGGDHYGVITPGDLGWTACVQAVEAVAAG
jgi:acetyl esterase/lipase